MAIRRLDLLASYTHPTNSSKLGPVTRAGFVDAYVGTANKTVSGSRTAMGLHGQAVVLATDATVTPFVQGMSAYPISLEVNTDLYQPGALEHLVFALSVRNSVTPSTHDADWLWGFDGTIPRPLYEFVTSSSFQLRTDAIGYSKSQYFLVVGKELVGSTIKAYKLDSSSFTDVSAGIPAGVVRDMVWYFSDNKLYCIHDLSGTTLSTFDGTTWASLTTASGTPVSVREYYVIMVATSAGVFAYDGSSLISDFTATAGYTVQDIEVAAGNIWAVEMDGSGNANVWYRSVDVDWTKHATFTNVGQAELAGNKNILSGSFNELFLAVTDTSDTTKTVTFYRRNGTVWDLEGSIYTGRRWEDSSNTASTPFYMTGSKRFANKSFTSLRGCMGILLPYSDSSPSSVPGNGVDFWGRANKKLPNSSGSLVPKWFHETSFSGYQIEDETNMIIPGAVARA